MLDDSTLGLTEAPSPRPPSLLRRPADAPVRSQAERDQLDAESEGFVRVCSGDIDALKSDAAALGGSAQQRAHRQAMLQLLYDKLQGIATLLDRQRGQRLQRAVDAREARLGAASRADAAGGGRGAGGAAGRGDVSRPGGGAAAVVAAAEAAAEMEWDDGEVVSDGGLEGYDQEQLQLENTALMQELNTMVEQVEPRHPRPLSHRATRCSLATWQAREAETAMLDISNLSHLFSMKERRPRPHHSNRLHRARAVAGRAAVGGGRAALRGGRGDV